MASSWGDSWSNAWGDSWGVRVQPDQQIHPTGGESLFKQEEEEVILTVINSFLFMRNRDGRD